MRGSTEEGKLLLRGSSPPTAQCSMRCWSQAVNPLGAPRHVLRWKQPRRPEPPQETLDLVDIGSATTHSGQP